MGSVTASGEKMNADALAAAHRNLPFGTKVRVDNLANGKSVVVRINDRGPFVGGRVIDVTRGAAKRLGMINSGVARVRVTVLDGRTPTKCT
jgi:rare lipoprotein A